jgi:hypothetical protein
MEIDKSTLEILKQLGRKNQTYDEIIRHRIKCNSTACLANGSIEIGVESENFGNITLFACSRCVGKFQN